MTDKPAGVFESRYTARGYSPAYGRQIDELVAWFLAELPAVAEGLVVTDAHRLAGIDSLPAAVKALWSRGFDQRPPGVYELSYNQMCVAFFAAYDQTQSSKPWENP